MHIEFAVDIAGVGLDRGPGWATWIGSGAIGLIVGVVVPIAMLEAPVESYRFAKKVG